MNKKAFTLIELLVVIMILGVLAALITGNFFTSLKKGRDAKRKGDLEQIQRALELYYEDKKTYPPALTFGSILSDPVSGQVYMQKVPNDPISGKSYQYTSAADGTSYSIYSCMENNLQILPYSNLIGTPTISCLTSCSNNEDPPVPKTCYWGVSSSNISP